MTLAIMSATVLLHRAAYGLVCKGERAGVGVRASGAAKRETSVDGAAAADIASAACRTHDYNH